MRDELDVDLRNEIAFRKALQAVANSLNSLLELCRLGRLPHFALCPLAVAEDAIRLGLGF